MRGAARSLGSNPAESRSAGSLVCARSAYFLLKDYAKARSDLVKAIELRPDYPDAKDVLERTDEQLKTAQAAAPPPPTPPPPTPPAPPPAPVRAAVAPPPAPAPKAAPLTAIEHEALGRQLIARDSLGEAIAELSEAVRLKPDSAHAYNARGYAYLRLRDYKHAVTDFDEAIRLDPKYETRTTTAG